MSEPKQWVIGDVHGCLRTLRTLMEDKLQPAKNDQLIFVGDYIDRGPDSKGVLAYLMELQLMGSKLILLKGNHEEMMLRSVHDKKVRKDWYYNGGMPTLRSFGVRETEEVPDHFMEFMRSMKYFHEIGNFLIVHAGLNFNIPNPMTDLESMLWIRNEIVIPEKIGNRTMVHGHTPVLVEKIKEAVENNAKDIDLDAGCVYWGTEGLGNLCALELNSMRLEVQANVDYI